MNGSSSASSAGLRTSIWASERSRPSRRWANSSSSVSLSSAASAPATTTSTSSTPTVTTTAETHHPGSASASASAPSSNRLTPAQAFHRFEQACQRLRWKFLDLQSSYYRATNPEDYGFTKADAEQNFKVDFHEFYVWIEQAIVLLLLIFGVTISRGGGYGSGSHAYHHNVLKALEEHDCPVHESLGRGEVIQALWKAKELRNRWKDAGEGKDTPPLKMYDLTWIVNTVLGGLEEGYHMATQKVENGLQTEMEQVQAGSSTMDVLDEEWEWMVEPMDWEAA
ncbi:hypothetical protein BGZ63DRAFT_42670 [Mariannaea sp. PMI_226]|nr:hypothetical protein BGZ63DRAFT_42670 [Mariannaea sp. PMI_226]